MGRCQPFDVTQHTKPLERHRREGPQELDGAVRVAVFGAREGRVDEEQPLERGLLHVGGARGEGLHRVGAIALAVEMALEGEGRGGRGLIPREGSLEEGARLPRLAQVVLEERRMIDEGRRLLRRTLGRARLGRVQGRERLVVAAPLVDPDEREEGRTEARAHLEGLAIARDGTLLVAHLLLEDAADLVGEQRMPHAVGRGFDLALPRLDAHLRRIGGPAGHSRYLIRSGRGRKGRAVRWADRVSRRAPRRHKTRCGGAGRTACRGGQS